MLKIYEVYEKRVALELSEVIGLLLFNTGNANTPIGLKAVVSSGSEHVLIGAGTQEEMDKLFDKTVKSINSIKKRKSKSASSDTKTDVNKEESYKDFIAFEKDEHNTVRF